MFLGSHLMTDDLYSFLYFRYYSCLPLLKMIKFLGVFLDNWSSAEGCLRLCVFINAISTSLQSPCFARHPKDLSSAYKIQSKEAIVLFVQVQNGLLSWFNLDLSYLCIPTFLCKNNKFNNIPLRQVFEILLMEEGSGEGGEKSMGTWEDWNSMTP